MSSFDSHYLRLAVAALFENTTPIDELFDTTAPIEGGMHHNALQAQTERMLLSRSNDANKLIVSLLTGMIHYNQSIMESVQALAHEVRTIKEALPPKEDPLRLSLDAKIDTLVEVFKSQPAPAPAPPIIIQAPTPPQVSKAPRSYAAAAKTQNPAPNKANNKSKQKEGPRTPPVRDQALPQAQRRFFASRKTPAPLSQADRLPVELSSIFGNLLARNGQKAPATSLSVSVNPKGTVTVLAPATMPSKLYAPFFDAMTSALNAWAGIPENPYNTFRAAPTNVDVAIHGIPLATIPNNEALLKVFPEAVTLATGITPVACRFLIKDNTIRATKNSSSVVIQVTPEEAATIGTSLRLFSRPRRCCVLTPATAYTMCHRCCLLGHPTASCKREPRCAICAKPHLTTTHRCPVATCPGAAKSMANCCEVSSATCPNCTGNHSALNPSCPVRTRSAMAPPPAQAPAPPARAPQSLFNLTPMDTR